MEQNFDKAWAFTQGWEGGVSTALGAMFDGEGR